ncbi:hypothetical protein [Herbaspirillum sp. SJZ107]|uniref:hypothetical protein n=1 Tax=Herbaspirillum sp. SJZ107 TaxID=2572881 RepID=UPI00114ED6A2|nr:hypothetical protein [Herbaspirillum sp. SJZ107]
MINMITKGIPSEKRSVLRRLQEVLPQIEDGLANGYSHKDMHAALGQLGISISLTYYHRVLAMLRKEKRESTAVVPETRQRVKENRRLTGSTGADLKAPDLSVAFNEESVAATSSIVEQPSEPREFKWDAKAAEKVNWNDL